ncbi:MAG: penicillin-binding protein 2 [Bacteroidales bacterium]|nr:penicillin-binding protein 2 [Bacteroidales bacterium]
MQHDFKLEKRKFIIGGLVLVVVLIYILRLFFLQIVDDKYKEDARNNAFLTRTIYPARGEIFDRHGRQVVYNQVAYDLVVTLREMKGLDTLAFCQTIGIDRETFEKRINDIKHSRGYSSYTQQVFTSQITGEDYANIEQMLWRFPGFDIRTRTIRNYMYPIAPHILGNIREVNPKEIERDPYYQRGDYVGDMGVEKSYETYLRGVKGKEILLRDAHGVVKGSYENGKYDIDPVPGRDLTLTIDAELQAYAESLMVNKVGALVAIEPKTGEILALVSSPTYDPRLLVGRQRSKNYSMLQKDPFKPLFNRAITASYPPGSTFKPTQGLIALQEGVINEHTPLPCHGGFRFGNFKMGCHDGNASWTIIPAIATSCNGFFGWCLYNVLSNTKKHKGIQQAFDAWKNYMVAMGYGYKLGIDLPGETRGFIPNKEFYNKAFRTDKWKPVSVISISIGQGEILATPLQIANLAATIANKGHYYVPHVIKKIDGFEQIPDTFLHPHHTGIDRQYYDLVYEGMHQAAIMGTVRRTGNLQPEGIILCGKTGTAQNPHGKDHSVFMGFAPYEDPKIAVCCYVQNGGFGATFGVPIGSLVIEKYLNGKISQRRKFFEENMYKQSTLNAGAMK